MDPAWIAVIGTLGGVIVTATSAVAVAGLTTRNQRHTLDRQRDHELAERRRAERRETFIDYLAAYSELREKILALHEQPQPAPLRSPSNSSRSRPLQLRLPSTTHLQQPRDRASRPRLQLPPLGPRRRRPPPRHPRHRPRPG